jgi:hypothetical protein
MCQKNLIMQQRKATFLKKHSLMSEENTIVQQKKAAFLMYKENPLCTDVQISAVATNTNYSDGMKSYR